MAGRGYPTVPAEALEPAAWYSLPESSSFCSDLFGRHCSGSAGATVIDRQTLFEILFRISRHHSLLLRIGGRYCSGSAGANGSTLDRQALFGYRSGSAHHSLFSGSAGLPTALDRRALLLWILVLATPRISIRRLSTTTELLSAEGYPHHAPHLPRADASARLRFHVDRHERARALSSSLPLSHPRSLTGFLARSPSPEMEPPDIEPQPVERDSPSATTTPNRAAFVDNANAFVENTNASAWNANALAWNANAAVLSPSTAFVPGIPHIPPPISTSFPQALLLYSVIYDSILS